MDNKFLLNEKKVRTTMTVKQKLILTSLRSASHHLVSQIHELKQDDPLRDITILLPSTAALTYFRTKINNLAAVYFLQFYSLADAILDEAALPVTLINDTTIRQIISKILSEMNQQGKLTSFAPVHEKQGFVTVLLQWLREMKSQGIHPDDYQAFAAENTSIRDAQLAEFYQRYQDYLHKHDYADPDGRLWLAAEALEKDTSLFTHKGPLFILGHDQFTPIQLNILKSLVDRFDEMTIYLHWSDQKNDDDLALTRLRETRDALLKNLPLQTISLPDPLQSKATLSHLGDHIFELSPETIPAEDDLQLIEAPSREVEVSVALRMAKSLLLEGVAPEAIGILAPNPNTYIPILRTIGEEYGIPLACDLH
jgi:ATP-dependent helicase/DNAse subunit B